MRFTRSTVSCTAGILSSARGFKDRGGTIVKSVTKHFRRNVLRTFQAVFRRPLSKASASFRQASRAKSMSSLEVDQPRLSRTAPWASPLSNPMAARTCDGWTLPEEHAEPEDTAIPPRSKPITAVSAFKPGTVNRVVFGNRGVPSENTIIPGVCRRPFSRRFRRPCSRAASPSKAAIAAWTAAPKAAIPATFSVPARRPSSCPPPRSSGCSPCTSSAKHHRSDALGAADLVRGKRDQISLHRFEIKRYFSQRLDRIDVQQPAGFMHDVSDFSDRLKRAGLVIGQHHGDKRGRPASKQPPNMVDIDQTRSAHLDGPDRLRRETPA